ncbi:MAG: M17 family peptidase N-terminal domain-containing protein, partial [Acidobacteriota bacterium]
MKVTISNAPATELESEALLLAFPEGSDKPTSFEALDAAYGGIITTALAGLGFNGKRNQALALSPSGGKARELLLVGLGPAAD